MKIIIVGTGSVGAAICKELTEEGHSVTIIDQKEKTVNDITSAYDITGIAGSGADIEILRAVGADKADLLIAVTQYDELNILCAMGAKRLGTTYTIARVRNPEYTELMRLLRDDIGLSLVINPEYAVAQEISRVLKLPTATKVDTFCAGRAEAVEFTVGADCPLIGKSLYELRGEIEVNFLVCAIRRGEEYFIPLGNTVIENGDTLIIIASDDNTAKFFKAIKSYKRPVRNVIISGAGRISYYIAELMKKSKMSVTVIDPDRDRCERLAAESSFNVIVGDGTNQELLLEEGIETADAFIALSRVDEENAIASMFAKTAGVPKVITLIRSLPYVDFFRTVGLDSIISPKSSTIGEILRFVRSRVHSGGSEIKSLHKLMGGFIEALEFEITAPISGLTGIPLRDIERAAGNLIACIVRGDSIIIPDGNDTINVHDKVIIVTTEHSMGSIKDILK